MARDPEKQRAAKRRYYDRNREVYLEKNRRKRERLRSMVRELKSRPCADCGGEFPFYVMDFDHREGEEKTAHVAMLTSSLSLKRLLKEIAKCDLVCANCHRVRTYKREQRFFRDGVMAARLTLDQKIGVRVPVPEPKSKPN